MSGVPSVSENPPSYVDELRRERDRFVALAFCAADVLLEVGAKLDIVYAAGATVAFTGVSPAKLVGRTLLEIMVPDDRPLVGELVHGMSVGNRIEPVPIRLLGPNGPTPQLMLTGYQLPELPNSMFFALRLGSGSTGDRTLAEQGYDPETGLHDSDSFAKLAGEHLARAGNSGEDLQLTLVRLQDFATVMARLDSTDADRLIKTVAACLRVGSGSQNAIGRFDSDNFGLIHKGDFDLDSLKSRIENHVKTADPDGIGISVSTGTIAHEADDVPKADLVKALHYSIKRFCDDDNAETAITELSGNLRGKVVEASRKMSNFREIVSASNFDIAYQPIVRIASGEICHFEALARFGGGSDRSPYELITFAENTGLICDFDYAMCRKLLEMLTQSNKAGIRYSVAVNLSGRSVGNTSFLSALQDLLKEFDDLRSQLIIEITESARIRDLEAANRFIQTLRKSGHTVCLDDFGAGAAALRYLHELDVDVVKIDGQYIIGAATNRKDRAFLKAIAGLCAELGISTIAEMVEHEATIPILQDCNVPYAQGYLFGKPSTDIESFTTIRPTLGWAGSPKPTRPKSGKGKS